MAVTDYLTEARMMVNRRLRIETSGQNLGLLVEDENLTMLLVGIAIAEELRQLNNRFGKWDNGRALRVTEREV